MFKLGFNGKPRVQQRQRYKLRYCTFNGFKDMNFQNWNSPKKLSIFLKMGTGCGNDLRFNSICAKLKVFRRKFILQNLWRRIRAFQGKKFLLVGRKTDEKSDHSHLLLIPPRILQSQP